MYKQQLRAALASKVAKAMGAVVVGTFATLQAAHAEIDTAVSGALTTIKADATSLNGLVTPIVISVLGMFIVLKLIKRFSNKI